MASTIRRPALAPRPVNSSGISSTQRPSTNLKRSRDDDADDATATRGSTKRSRVDDVPSPMTQPPLPHVGTPLPSKGTTNDALIQTPTNEKTVDKENATVKRSRAEKDKARVEKEKARAARHEAEELFVKKYRSAFPSWRFYFDGVPVQAVAAVSKKIKLLGGVVEEFLSKEVTHFVTPNRVDQKSGNGSSRPSLAASAPQGVLLSPVEIRGYDPVEKAREWNLKLWHLEKLESVLERLLRKSSALDLAQQKKSSALLTLETVQQKKSQSLPLDNLSQRKAPAIGFSSKPVFPSTIKPIKPAPRPVVGIGIPAGLPSAFPPGPPRRVYSASATLAGLLATEKATNTTMERDPHSKRHDYTYFTKLAAFVCVDVIWGDYKSVGQLEYKVAKSTATLTLPPIRFPFKASNNPEYGTALTTAHKDANTGQPSYPILVMDPRMRNPFQPYSSKLAKKEQYAECRDDEDQRDRQHVIRFARAEKRAHAQFSLMEVTHQLTVATAMANAAAHMTPNTKRNHLEQDGGFPKPSTDLPDHRASGFIRSTANGESFASLSTATGVPTTLSSFTTSHPFSFSSGTGSWAKNIGAGGFVPTFSGVRHATQVVMNRGAFAVDAAATDVTTESVSTTARTSTLPSIDAAGGMERSMTAGMANIRRTKSLVSMKATIAEKVAAVETKTAGWCECCKEHYDSLKEHINGRKHRKFASDPRRYSELDELISRLARPLKSERATLDRARADAREKMIASLRSLRKGQPSIPVVSMDRSQRPTTSSSDSNEKPLLPALKAIMNADLMPSNHVASGPSTAASEDPPTIFASNSANTSDCSSPVEVYVPDEIIDLTASTSDAPIVDLNTGRCESPEKDTISEFSTLTESQECDDITEVAVNFGSTTSTASPDHKPTTTTSHRKPPTPMPNRVEFFRRSGFGSSELSACPSTDHEAAKLSTYRQVKSEMESDDSVGLEIVD
ncbi:hypothetical protein FRC14_001543 [Serendipita sp. 396]|nr:hypothetical protein FRC14_001543 [Serendipita sp. 396]